MGDRLATIDVGRKLGRGCYAPFLGGRNWAPSNTMWPGPRPTSYQMASWSIQPFDHYTNVTDRQDRTDRQTDNGPIG